MECQQHSKIGTSCQNAPASHHEEHEVREGDPNRPLGAATELTFNLFMVMTVQSHSPVSRRHEVSTPLRNWTSRGILANYVCSTALRPARSLTSSSNRPPTNKNAAIDSTAIRWPACSAARSAKPRLR